MELLWYPHDALRNKCLPLTMEQITSEGFRQVVSRMFLIMYRLGGVGLAAPQVGFNLNLLVGNPDGRANHESSAFVLINPTVTPIENTLSTLEEGCLSFPGIYAPITRHDKVNVSSLDVNGNENEFEVAGFLSRIIQHEYDHLNGTLFIDRMNVEARQNIDDSLMGHVNRVRQIRKKREKEAKKARAEAKKKADAKKRRKLKRKKR